MKVSIASKLSISVQSIRGGRIRQVHIICAHICTMQLVGICSQNHPMLKFGTISYGVGWDAILAEASQ